MTTGRMSYNAMLYSISIEFPLYAKVLQLPSDSTACFLFAFPHPPFVPQHEQLLVACGISPLNQESFLILSSMTRLEQRFLPKSLLPSLPNERAPEKVKVGTYH